MPNDLSPPAQQSQQEPLRFSDYESDFDGRDLCRKRIRAVRQRGAPSYTTQGSHSQHEPSPYAAQCTVHSDISTALRCTPFPFVSHVSKSLSQTAAGSKGYPPNLPVKRLTPSRAQSAVLSIHKRRDAAEHGSVFIPAFGQESETLSQTSVACSRQPQPLSRSTLSHPVLLEHESKDHATWTSSHEIKIPDASHNPIEGSHGPSHTTSSQQFGTWLQRSLQPSIKSIPERLMRGMQLLPFQSAPDEV
jgi:hypothetical protein